MSGLVVPSGPTEYRGIQHLPLEAVLSAPIKSMVEEKLDEWYDREVLIDHPTKGMLSKGFSLRETEAARQTIEGMIEFYEDWLDEL